MSISMATETILITVLLLILPLLFLLKKLKPQSPPLPPSPFSWPVISTINHLRHPFTPSSLANIAQSHGPLIRFNIGTQLLVVASSPTTAAEILKTNDRALAFRSVPHAVPLSPSQINTLSFWGDPTSDHWRNIRTICRSELFSAAAQEAQARLRGEKTAELVEKVKSGEGAATDVGRLVYAAVVNFFGNVFFSRDVVGLDDEIECGRVRGLLRGIIGAISATNLSDFYPFLGAFDFQGLRKKHRELSMEVWEIWKTTLKERRSREKGDSKHGDFLDRLISRGFGDEQINHLLEDLFSAGIDTTTSTVNRTLIELIATPQSHAKLKLELDSAFEHGFTPSHIDNLPYLQACIKETLRLHPPAPLLLSHRAAEKCQVMAHTIPKNARILVNVWAIGRDPTVWEEPLQYRPERFLDSSVDFKGNDFELLPFGAGRRICPGMPMATKIVPLIVASLVYYFDWSLLEGSVDDNFRATSQIRGPLLLHPRPRK